MFTPEELTEEQVNCNNQPCVVTVEGFKLFNPKYPGVRSTFIYCPSYILRILVSFNVLQKKTFFHKTVDIILTLDKTFIFI